MGKGCVRTVWKGPSASQVASLRKSKPANTFILDFWPLKEQGNKLLCWSLPIYGILLGQQSNKFKHTTWSRAVCSPQFKGIDGWDPRLLTSECRPWEEKVGGGKDKDRKRKWGIAAAESGPLWAQLMKRLCIQFTPENGPGNESWHHSPCLKMANEFYICFFDFLGSNRTNHDHVGDLKQLKFIFPLFSQPEVWDKGVGRVDILGRREGPIHVTSLTFVYCLQLLPSLLFMPVSPCVFICSSPLDFLCYLIFFRFF